MRLKVSCERTLGSKGTACGCEALLLDVRSLQGKVSKQIPVSRKREKENHAPHVFFNFAPGYTLTDCLLSCSVQSSKIPTLLRGRGTVNVTDIFVGAHPVEKGTSLPSFPAQIERRKCNLTFLIIFIHF